MRSPLPAAQGQRGGAEPHLHRYLRPAGRADARGGRQGRYRTSNFPHKGRRA